MAFPLPNHASECVVLVPANGAIEPGCERGLRELEALGYEVRRISGYAAIDQARNQMASDALADGFQETMWIDSDIVFRGSDVEQLRSADCLINCGIYPKKGQREIACHVKEGTENILFGEGGGLIELRYAATGFMLVRAEAYERIETQLALPRCNGWFGRTLVPYFLPLVIDHKDSHWYLAEDYAFCERARQCHITIHADTRIRLRHIGRYEYGWEDAGEATNRYATYRLDLQ